MGSSPGRDNNKNNGHNEEVPSKELLSNSKAQKFDSKKKGVRKFTLKKLNNNANKRKNKVAENKGAALKRTLDVLMQEAEDMEVEEGRQVKK